jgi:hypothetical protein
MVAPVSATRPGQHRVEMPDGLVVDRLPLGFANGLWRLSFVVSGMDLPVHRRHAVRAAFIRGLYDRIRVEGSNGTIDQVGSGTSGGEHEHQLSMDLRAVGATGLRVSYLQDERVVDTEVLPLD